MKNQNYFLFVKISIFSRKTYHKILLLFPSNLFKDNHQCIDSRVLSICHTQILKRVISTVLEISVVSWILPSFSDVTMRNTYANSLRCICIFPIINFKAFVMVGNKLLRTKMYIKGIKNKEILAKLVDLLCAWLTVTTSNKFSSASPTNYIFRDWNKINTVPVLEDCSDDLKW